MGFFDGSGRIGRLTYLGVGLAIWLVSFFSSVAFIQFDEGTQEPIVNPLLFLVLAGATWLSATTTIQRLHDIGRSGWTALLLLVPIIGPALSLYLLVAPGDKVRNLYGQPPGANEISAAEQRHRMDVLATAAGEAYRARAASSYLNEDGSYNMEGLGSEGQSSA